MMPVEVRVRAARADDRAQLCAWMQAMAQESEGLVLDPARLDAGLAAGLADPARARYFIAEYADEAVGTLMLTCEWSDWRNGWWWWIQSVYVVPAARRRGIYRALHAHAATQAAAEPSVLGLRLYVAADNRAAQSTYVALGMHDSGYRVYEQPLHDG
jgi:GNAT superfamily N-acetyltransferase